MGELKPIYAPLQTMSMEEKWDWIEQQVAEGWVCKSMYIVDHQYLVLENSNVLRIVENDEEIIDALILASMGSD